MLDAIRGRTAPPAENGAELYALRRGAKRPATPAEVDSTRAVQREGAGENAKVGLLFLHGFTVTPANFRGWLEDFSSLGFAISVPMLPGHGSRPEDLEGVSWTEWLEAALEAYDELARGRDRVVVIGISLGGALAAHLASRRPVDQLFLLAPAVYPLALLDLGIKVLVPALQRLGLSWWIQVAGDVRRPDGFEIGYGRTPIRALLQLHECMLATQPVLPSVTADAVIFQGLEDHEVPADRAREVLSALGSEQKELIWLANSFHEIPRDADSRLVFEHIRDRITHPR